MVSPCRVETTLSAGARSGARIALIAGGGAGKSSVVSHVEDTAFAGATLQDAVTEQAVEALFDSYAEGGSLRKSLQTVHIALAEAASADDETIGASHIIAARRA